MRAHHLAPLLWAWSTTALAQDDGSDDADPPAPAEEAEEADDEDASDDAPTLAELQAQFELMKAQLEAQQAELELQKAKLDATESKLDKQRESLTQVRLAKAKGSPLTFDITGYYRARGYVFGAGNATSDRGVGGGLYENQPTSGQYLNQRLRLGLKASYKDVANVNVHVQALDNVLWGDNDGLTRTALFAESPSRTRIDGTEAPPFELFRAWTEFRIPIGQFRIGRMSSHWGLGLLANDGDGFRNDFGEAYFGNQFDRIMFATNPVAIAQAITKKKEVSTPPVFLVIAYDKLVSDPFVQYCKPGRSFEDDPIGFYPGCDEDFDGTEDVTDYADPRAQEYEALPRPRDTTPAWWTDQRDDVNEMVYALFYRGQGIKYLGGIGDLFAGMYVIHRWQETTDSDVIIIDGAIDATVHGAILQFEGLGIVGKSRAIALKNADNPDDLLFKQAGIASYALRVGYKRQWFKAIVESGMASGDENLNNELFTGRAANPDYNVGLLLYEEVLREITRQKLPGNASALSSKGGVYNSHYLNPRVYFYPFNNTEIILGGLVAFPDQPDGAVILKSKEEDPINGVENASAILGWELDLAIKHQFHEHIWVSAEMAYAEASNRLPLANTGLSTDGKFFTFQARGAFVF